MTRGLVVRGAASAEELAAVLAVLAHSSGEVDRSPTGYEKWRATRRRALWHSADGRDLRGVRGAPS
jgi:hypothetical protein